VVLTTPKSSETIDIISLIFFFLNIKFDNYDSAIIDIYYNKYLLQLYLYVKLPPTHAHTHTHTHTHIYIYIYIKIQMKDVDMRL